MDDILIKSTIKIKGRVKWKKYTNGKLVQIMENDNIITNTGLKVMRDLLKGKGFPPSHIGLGSGTDVEGANNSSLQTPIPSKAVEIKQGETEFFDDGRIFRTRKRIVDANTIEWERTLPASLSNINFEVTDPLTITEAGLFNRYAGADMFSRDLFDIALTKRITDQVNIVWEYSITRENAFSPSNTIVDTGLEMLIDVLHQKDKAFKNSEHLNYGITHVAVGGNNESVNSGQTKLNSEFPTVFSSGGQIAHGRRPVTRYDTDDSDPAAPKLKIQREIQFGQFLGAVGNDIKEVGLFNQHLATPSGGALAGESQIVTKMFSRVALDNSEGRDVIPNNTKKTITFEITIKRG